MKNTFLQAVSHDLRTPLAGILGLAVTMAREDLQLDQDEMRDLARRIAQNARRLDRLVTDLLDLDRLTRGIIEPLFRPTDVGALVWELVADSELLADRKVDVKTTSIVIACDRAKVERIVENLLGNAAKHTPSTARIWVRVEPWEGGALIVIEDDGPGVPPDQREKIFEAFLQGETSVATPVGCRRGARARRALRGAARRRCVGRGPPRRWSVVPRVPAEPSCRLPTRTHGRADRRRNGRRRDRRRSARHGHGRGRRRIVVGRGQPGVGLLFLREVQAQDRVQPV